MKSQENHFEFAAKSTHQAEFSDGGDMVAPGGKDLAELIATKLSKKYEVSEIILYSCYAWSWLIRDGKFSFLCLIQDLDPWLLTVENKSTIISRVLGKSATSYMAVLDSIEQAIREDHNFELFRRMHREDYYKARRKTAN